MKTKGIFGTRSARLDLFKPGKSRAMIRLVLVFFLALFIISPAARLAVAGKVPSERRVRKAVEKLNFLPEESKQNLVLSIRTGAKDGLLSFSGGIGTRTLLKVIASQNSPPQKKSQLIEILQGAIKWLSGTSVSDRGQCLIIWLPIPKTEWCWEPVTEAKH